MARIRRPPRGNGPRLQPVEGRGLLGGDGRLHRGRHGALRDHDWGTMEVNGEIDLTADQRRIVLELIARHLPDTDVWAYGSRVAWTSRPESDLDLVVFSGADQSDQVADLREALEESGLPFRVDVLVWDELPESFQEAIDDEHVELFALHDYPSVPIGDIAEIVGGGTPSTKNPANFGGAVPWLTPRDLSRPHHPYVSRGARNLSRQGLTASSASLVPQGAVLLSTRAPIGYTAIAACPLATNQGFRSLVPSNRILTAYLYYWLTANVHELQRHATGSTFAELSGRALKQIRMPLPPVSVQRRLTQVLEILDDKIELNRRMIATLDSLLRAVFSTMMKQYNQTYRLVRLGDVMDINPRRSLRKGAKAPHVSMANMPTNGHSPLSIVGRPYGHGMRFANGDTLVARITPCLENGKTAYVDFLPPNAVGWGSTEYVVLRPKKPVPTEFAYCLARSSSFRDFAVGSMTGSSGRQRVSPQVLAEYQFVLPPQRVLNGFSNVARLCISRARSAVLQSPALVTMRDAMLSATVTRTYESEGHAE